MRNETISLLKLRSRNKAESCLLLQLGMANHTCNKMGGFRMFWPEVAAGNPILGSLPHVHLQISSSNWLIINFFKNPSFNNFAWKWLPETMKQSWKFLVSLKLDQYFLSHTNLCGQWLLLACWAGGLFSSSYPVVSFTQPEAKATVRSVVCRKILQASKILPFGTCLYWKINAVCSAQKPSHLGHKHP